MDIAAYIPEIEIMAGKICPNCYHIGKPKRVMKGSFFIEVIMWLCLIIPGLIYTVWRLLTRYDACALCGCPTVVRINTAAGKRLIARKKQSRETFVVAP